jgi:ketosteroid isomerase-like protein
MSADDVPAASAAIAAACRALDEALMASDAHRAASHFTADAILGESGLDDVVGREAILDFLVRGDAVRTVTHHRLHRKELLVFGELAVEYGWFDETKRRAGQPPIHERGRTMTLWRRDADGEWRIHRLVISDLPLAHQ